MPVCQSRADVPRATASHLASGQVAVRDLRAGASIVAVEGALQLEFRDHSLAWLGNDAPLTSISLHEGERYVTAQRGVVSIGAMHANAAAFIVLPFRADSGAHGFMRRAAHHLVSLVRTRLRRAV